MKTSIFQNSNKNIVRISALKFLVASCGLPGSFWGLLGDLVSNMINKKAYRKPKKDKGSPNEAMKTFRAEILTKFTLIFWKIDVFINSF